MDDTPIMHNSRSTGSMGPSPHIETLLERVLAREPRSVNTDWDGALVVAALLEWESGAGRSDCGDFARRWFDTHTRDMTSLTDAEFRASYQGPPSRVLRTGTLLFSGYSGHWGQGHVLPGLSSRVDDHVLRRHAAALANYLAYQAPRSVHGCLLHDDLHAFLVPDTCYLAAPSLAIAAHLTGKEAYLDSAVEQLILYSRVFQDERTGLSRTMWSPDGMADVFWIRASGWLAGALAGTLPHIPVDRREYPELVERFQRIAGGLIRVQQEDGGFHVFLDRPDTPLECSGTALIARALGQGVRMGTLDADVSHAATAAWRVAEKFVDPEGHVHGVYTSWAMPASQGKCEESMFDRPPDRDFAVGIMLLAAADFLQPAAMSSMTANQTERRPRE